MSVPPLSHKILSKAAPCFSFRLSPVFQSNPHEGREGSGKSCKACRRGYSVEILGCAELPSVHRCWANTPCHAVYEQANPTRWSPVVSGGTTGYRQPGLVSKYACIAAGQALVSLNPERRSTSEVQYRDQFIYPSFIQYNSTSIFLQQGIIAPRFL